MGEGKNPIERSPTWMDEEHEDVWRNQAIISHPGFFNPFDNGVWSYVCPWPMQTPAIAFTSWKEETIWVIKPYTGTEEEAAAFE